MAVNTDEASLTRSPLTSCCVAQLLAGLGSIPVRGLRIGEPGLKKTPYDRASILEAKNHRRPPFAPHSSGAPRSPLTPEMVLLNYP